MGRGGEWRAERAITYPLTISYKARMWPAGTRTNPSPMLRTSGGGASGQESGILVVPNDGVNYPARFRWDMSDLAPGSTTTSGLTDENDVRAPIQTLLENFFMAGPLLAPRWELATASKRSGSAPRRGMRRRP